MEVVFAPMFFLKIWAATGLVMVYFSFRVYQAYRGEVHPGDHWLYPPHSVVPVMLLITLGLWFMTAYGWMCTLLVLTALFKLWQYRLNMQYS